MLRNALDFMRANVGFFAIVIVATAVLPALAPAAIASLLEIVASSALLFLIYRRLLRQASLNPFSPGAGVAPAELFGFVWRDLVIVVISVAIPILLLLAVTRVDLANVNVSIALIYGSTVLLELSAVWGIAYFGTWLPAYVYGQNPTFQAARKRGQASFGSLAWRFTLLSLGVLAIGFALVQIDSPLGLSDATWLHWLIIIPITGAINWFVSVYIAVALCQVYLTLEKIV
ncbi:hypothetical protein [Martelella sp. FOR1707]